ncbi:MAG: hypothetical protein K2M69_07855 [Muribaculaceae bacterium]|nr:hypothetical protein [Muribaculaceae bacterium]
MVRKFILLLFAVIFLAPSYAEKIKIDIKTSSKSNSNQPIIHRAPMQLPIEAMYDPDAMIIEISCPSDLVGEVYVYDAGGIEEVYSPCLNVVLSVSDSQYHIIVIEGDDWIGTGVIE